MTTAGDSKGTRRFLVALGLGVALVLTSCGSDSETAEGDAGTSAPAEGSDSTAASSTEPAAPPATWPEQDPALIAICDASREVPPSGLAAVVEEGLADDAAAYAAMVEASFQGGDAPEPVMSPELQAVVDAGCVAASYPDDPTAPWFTLLRIEGAAPTVTVVILGECPDGTVPTDVTVFGEPVEEVAPGEYGVESDVGQLPMTPEDLAIPAKGLIRMGSVLDAVVNSGGKGPEMFEGTCPGT